MLLLLLLIWVVWLVSRVFVIVVLVCYFLELIVDYSVYSFGLVALHLLRGCLFQLIVMLCIRLWTFVMRMICLVCLLLMSFLNSVCHIWWIYLLTFRFGVGCVIGD